MSKRIVWIVFIGGPGGGKTKGMDKVKEELIKLGYYVISKGETATEVMNEGILPYGPNALDAYDFQKIIIERQLKKEANALEEALSVDGDVAILLDRGLIDGKAYMPKEQWPELLKEFDLTEQAIMNHYDIILDETSTAVDRPDIYLKIKSNNPRRSEDVEQAREKDRITLEGYVGHHNLYIVDNSTTWEEKIRRVVDCILTYLNVPFHFNHQHKYLVDLDNSNLDVLKRMATKIGIEQTYLAGPEGLDIKVRKATINGEETYYLIIKRKDGVLEEIIKKKAITKSEYEAYLTEQDKNLGTVVKTRYSFIYKNEKWNLDVFPDSNIAILENETTADINHLQLPEFLSVIRKRDDLYNHDIAKNGIAFAINGIDINLDDVRTKRSDLVLELKVAS